MILQATFGGWDPLPLKENALANREPTMRRFGPRMSDGLTAGQRIGPYRVLFRLGKGGMGEVWAACRGPEALRDRELVALKVLLNQEKDSNATVMFLDEARAASLLEHPSIVPTVDVGQDDEDIFYLAMEMVHGPSLTALLQRLVINRSQMTPAMIGYVGVNMADALDYAQTQASFEGRPLKLIHRDVSPHNVLLDLNGSVQLTDFGVARTTIQDHKSRVGTVRGKPSYMAPEQVVGGAIDGRTDLFALGTVLYESACLKRLFGRNTPFKSMDAVLKHTPKPLTEVVPGFPEDMWRVIKKALEKAPENRFQSAAEMSEALSEALGNLPDAPHAATKLMRLVRKNFDPKAFDTDSKIQEALKEAEINLTDAVIDPTVTRSPQAPISQDRPIEAGGTQVAWPTAYAPDPLAPEAIELARTQFRALTPSVPAAQHMPHPSLEMAVATSQEMAVATSQSQDLRWSPRGSSVMPAILLSLVAVAVLLVAFVVSQTQPLAVNQPAPMADPTLPTPGVKPGIVAEAKAEQTPTPSAAPSRSDPLPAKPKAGKVRRTKVKPLTKRQAPKTKAPKIKTPKAKAKKAKAKKAKQATFAGVAKEIRELEKHDREAASRLRATLTEIGRGNPARLQDLHRQVQKALASKKDR